MIPRVIIIRRKAGIASINGAEGSGGLSEPLNGGFRGWSPLRKSLDSKGLDWLKIYLNATKIITVQDYKCTKK